MRILPLVCVVFFDSSLADDFYDCLIPNYALQDAERVLGVVTLEGCQAACVVADCKAWTFQATSCKMTNSTTPSVGWVNPSDEGGGSMTWLGKCNCPSSQVEDQDFPGASLTESGADFKRGHQPLGVQCWPKTNKGKLMQCSLEVLESTQNGWAGNCAGLIEQTLIPGADCEKSCHENPWCSTWQLVTKNESGEDSGCWQGVGYDCLKGRVQKFKAHSARLQHGRVKVIANLTDYQIQGLLKVFGTKAYPTEEAAIENCKEVCYSDLHCQYWQYFNKTGCWIESAPANMVSYPMALDQPNLKTFVSPDEQEGSLTAGQYIQHYCEPPEPFNWSLVPNGNLVEADRVWVPATTLVCVLREGSPPQTWPGRRTAGVFTLPDAQEPSGPVNIAQKYTRSFACVTPTTSTTVAPTTTAEPDELGGIAAGIAIVATTTTTTEAEAPAADATTAAEVPEAETAAAEATTAAEVATPAADGQEPTPELTPGQEATTAEPTPEEATAAAEAATAVEATTAPDGQEPTPELTPGQEATTAEPITTVALATGFVPGNQTNDRRLSIGKESLAAGQWGTIMKKVDHGLYAGLFEIKLADGRFVHARPEDLLLEEGGAPPLPTAAVVETATAPPSSIGPWLLGALLTAALAGLAILVWCCYCQEEEKPTKPRKGRGRKIEAEPEPVSTAPPTETSATPIVQAYSAPPSVFVAPPPLVPAPPVSTYAVPVQYAAAPPPAAHYTMQSVAAEPVAAELFVPTFAAPPQFAAIDDPAQQHFITGPASYPTGGRFSANIDPGFTAEPIAAPAGSILPMQHYG